MGKKGGYITVQEWMLDLGLRPAELMAYALVYGYSQDGRSTFQGSSEYVARWIGLSRQSALAVLKGLVDKGFIARKETVNGAIKRVEYRVKKVDPCESRKLTRASQETLPEASQETLHNNTSNNTSNIINGGVSSIFDR